MNFLAFKSTDLDVNDILNFLTRYGELNLDEVIDVYKMADTRVLYIDAAEKFFICEYQETFEDILNRFMAAGWKIILRTGILFKTPYYTVARFRPIMSNRLTLINCPLYPIPMVFSCHRTSGCWICSVRLSIWAYIWLWETSKMNRCVL